MKKNRLLALLLVLVMMMSITLTSCFVVPDGGGETPDDGGSETPDDGGNEKPDDGNKPDDGGNETPDDPKPEEDLTFKLPYAEGTILRMATGYNSAETGLSFAASVAGDGITLADGKTYHTGDLKPTWVAVQDILKIKIEDKYQGKSAKDEFNYWAAQLDQVDLVSGTAALLSEHGTAGKLINLADYLDDMPNFKKYLEENPIVLLSISAMDANNKVGGIYFSPYFDGVNDIERMPLMRTDWVEKLLNGEGEFTAEASKNLAAAVYTPYMPTSGKVTVDVVKADASGTEQVTKDYDKAGNIIAKMNAAGTLNGVQAVNMLRKYIDEAYNGYYGTNRADLFIGQNAAWDADELVALLRCVVANPQTLNGTDSVNGLFSREDGNNQRRVDMFRFASTLFGVRGLESRQDYLYVGADGQLHDARQEEDTYIALERMNAMVKEGLISKSFIEDDNGYKSETMLKNDAGFMHYDYNQTQTIYNATALGEGEKYMAVIIPVARWFDGSDPNGVYMRFTESWRSVKTDGWGISAAGVAGNDDKLHAALALIDYAYSEAGQILMSYSSDDFIKKDENGDYVTFDFNGKEMPVISDKSFEFLWNSTKKPGNYTDYARQYLGSTLSFAKSQAFEYQCTHPVGQEGAGKISNAIKYGIIKHPELAITDNPWYSIVPTTLPQSVEENKQIKELTNLGDDRFSQSKDDDKKGVHPENLLVDLISEGYPNETGIDSRSALLNTIKETWGGKYYIRYRNDAYARLLAYYESLTK